MQLHGKKILLGVSGGIAAYKSALIVRLLRKEQAQVRVIMTASAQEFITPLTMASLSEHDVGLDMFHHHPQSEILHIEWADWAEFALIAPATANVMGKTANGIADDLLSSTILAIQCPIAWAPAMHHQMWSHPSVQNNIKTLRQFGYYIIEPGEGDLASGDIGIGRMREADEIVDFLKNL